MIKTATPLSRLFTMLLLAFGLTAAAQPCGTFVFSFDITPVSCPGSCDGAATVMVSGTTGPVTYSWVPSGGTTAIETGLCAGTYTVTVTDSLGCDSSAAVTISEATLEPPSICMVTCNGNSTYNVVYWDKTIYTNVDSFLVYREVMPGSYARIASVSNDSLSEFIDTAQSIGPANGDPNLAPYRYKLQIRNMCGNYSALSPYHSTIHIIDAGAGEFAWSIPYTIEGEPNPVTNYVLLCDTAGVDIWGPVAVVPPTDTTAIDPGFSSHPTIANWRVKTNWGIVCTSTRATVNTTRSNIKSGMVATGMATMLSGNVLLYPNPAQNTITIELSDLIQNGEIRIYNAMGQEVYAERISGNNGGILVRNIDVSRFARGLYSLVMDHAGQRLQKKLVVN